VGPPAGNAARAERRRHLELSGPISSERRRAVDRHRRAISIRVRGRPHERPGRLETDADEAHGGARVARGRGGARGGRLREQLGGLQERPSAAGPIVITGYISHQRVSVSPDSFGAGPISLIVTNQTGTAQRVTLESAGPAGSGPGIKQVTAPISPQDTATLKVDVKPGSYSVHVGGDAIRAARLKVGPERESAAERPVATVDRRPRV
jgi:hypothetical protein